jgi:hypothetical protein
MRDRDIEAAAPAPPSAKDGDRAAAVLPLGAALLAARSGHIAPRDLLRLQRTAGNRAVARMLGGRPRRRPLARAPADQREMLELGGKTDERIPTEAGDFVWDEFDRTLTLFTKLDGPYKGQALRVTYKDGTREDLEKMKPEDRYTKYEVLSTVRARALEWMRTAQGKYQETEAGRAARVGTKTTGQTLCNSHTGNFLTEIAGKGHRLLFGLDPRAIATENKRAGAFHTIYSHPEGPKPGDVISYGKITAGKKGGLREAEFGTTTHVGVFKSARPGPGGTIIWTVVDGGQGKFVSRQETRERTRAFSKERLVVSMSKLSETGKAIGQLKEEMECAVLKSDLADAGQGADDKLLRGWIDVDEFLGGDDVSTASDLGANNPVFVGKRPAPTPTAATP